MMVRLIVASVIVAAPAAFGIGYWQSLHQGDTSSTVSVRLNAPILTKPGAGAADAAKYFNVLNTPPPPPLPPSALPPDVGLTFRRDVTAVTVEKTPHVILVDGRQLARGQEYRDGWKVRDVTSESVMLAKGSDTRSINLFSTPQTAAAAPVQAGLTGVGGFGQISLTNGEKPGQLNTGAINRILGALQALGLNQVQLDQLRRTLSGTMTQQQATQMINNTMRGRTASQIQINNLVQAFVSAGVLSQGAANGLTQQLFSQQQNQQVQGILSGRGGGGAPAGGGRGGPPARRGGPLGLTPPNVTPGLGLTPAPLPPPAPQPTTPLPAPTAQRGGTSQTIRLAQLTGRSQPDRATPQ